MDPYHFSSLDPDQHPNPHPDPHHSDKLDPEPDLDPHQFADDKAKMSGI